MTDTNNTGDKTISVTPRKTLGLKRAEHGTVRQSFSHGRTNTVQVERKKRRVILPGEQKAETPAPKPAQSEPAPAPTPPGGACPGESRA